MANELNLALGQTGQTVTARLIAAGAYVGNAIACNESPASSGYYTGSVPGGTAAGNYDVIFLNGSTVVGSGRLFWDGTAEIGLLELAARNWSNSVVGNRTITGGIISTVSDKTGYSLTQAFPANFANLAITAGGLVTAGTVSDKAGYSLSSTQTFNLTGSITGNLSGSVGSVSGAVGSVTGNVGGSVASVASAVTVGTNNDKSGYSLSSAGVQAIWDTLTSALTTVGSIGKRLADNLDATISSRSTYAGADTSGTTALLSRLTSVRAGYLDNLSAGAVALQSTVSALPSASTIATQVWGSATSGLTGVGTVGKLLTDQLDATISSRLASAGYTAPPSVSSIWSNVTRTLTEPVSISGTVAANVTQVAGNNVLGISDFKNDLTAINNAIAAIPTNPLLTNDSRLGNLDATISSRLASSAYTAPLSSTATQSAATAAIAAYGTAKVADVQVTVNPTPVTVNVSGQFEEIDRNLLQTLRALAEADESVTPTRYQKLAAGTNTVLLDKDVSDDGAGSINLVQRP